MMPQSPIDAYLMFIGSYAEPDTSGIRVFSLNAVSGETKLLHTIEGLKNPSFLDLDHEGMKLYAIEETTTEDGGRGGSVVSFAFTAEGIVRRLNAQKSVGGATCHIEFNAVDRYVTVASYSGGLIGLLPVNEDGTLAQTTDMHRSEGTLGPNTVRQDRPHPHSTYTAPDRTYVYSPDLGLDRIKRFKFDPGSMKLIPSGETATAPGAGPRHMAFHPARPWVYVINELNGTITFYEREASGGELREIQTVSTLPDSFQGENTTAEVQLSPNGKYLYGSNRGHDSIAVYEVDQANGRLTTVEIVPSGGRTPRNFGITPDGRYLVTAHQESGNLAIFRLNEETGRLEDTGHRAEAAKGVCVKFWKKPGAFA
ncbi:lactonase family protein [Paenibacillus filicis]|uniref:Lactonase family protein n=1 Tax=Paenibacillus gyeongsangnamensis TaxID=3388067 RepID=A0ABT4Q5W7_9BACL|nr:lactonase family protein [Paenibacillus filicis]MCZ8512268.1 lactonase family protein [Paenibacillus filicis]